MKPPPTPMNGFVIVDGAVSAVLVSDGPRGIPLGRQGAVAITSALLTPTVVSRYAAGRRARAVRDPVPGRTHNEKHPVASPRQHPAPSQRLVGQLPPYLTGSNSQYAWL